MPKSLEARNVEAQERIAAALEKLAAFLEEHGPVLVRKLEHPFGSGPLGSFLGGKK